VLCPPRTGLGQSLAARWGPWDVENQAIPRSPPQPQPQPDPEQLQMTEQERLDSIHAVLVNRYTHVRKSCLVYYDMLSSYEEYVDHLGKTRVREVMWMNATHLFYPIIQYNADHGGFGKNCVIHRSDLAGMPMRGVLREYVNAVVELVWSGFCRNLNRYPLYAENGSTVCYAAAAEPSLPTTTPTELQEEDTDGGGGGGMEEVVIDLEPSQSALLGAAAPRTAAKKRPHMNGYHVTQVPYPPPPPPAPRAAAATPLDKTEKAD
jgi:hypothetical protein